jgi:hypothetical protein
MIRVVAIVIVLLPSPATQAADWGDLSLRIVYDSDKLPVPKPIAAAAGVAFCGGLAGLKSDDLLVNPKDRGVANVFVYLLEDAGAFAVHPDYAKSPKNEAVMTNKGCAFDTNPDPVGHNMKLDSFDNASFNLAIAAGGKITNTFKLPETVPLTVTCTSHRWMAGLVLVRSDPYAAISDASGKVKLANVPAGKWKFRIWHERCGYIPMATLGGKPIQWPRGRIEWEIKPGANDLGDVLVRPAVFKE